MKRKDTDTESKEPSKNITFSNEEFNALIISLVLDLAEYFVPILLSPIIGDIFDIVGLIAGLTMFGWMGFLAVFEFVPFADVIPIFTLIWIFWIYWKREKKKRDLESFTKKWR